ncbi:MAG: substrate-binding domain-containing protein [Oscillospiraceae bacterium]|jgi:putative molybdopterin biosynthesis protein
MMEVSQIETNLLTAQEVADILKVKKSTVYEMIKRGDLSSRKIGKQLRISRQEMERLLGTDTTKTESFPLPECPPVSPLRKENSFILSGQDVLLDVFANHMNGSPGLPNILRSQAGSYNGLYQLYQGSVDLATCHLWDETTGEYNTPFVERMLPGVPVVMIRLLGRMIGLYVHAGNPKGITGWNDLRRGDITLVNRERGSGARVLLDGKLKSMGISGISVPGYPFEQPSSLSVASCVARGAGDVGVGTKHTSRQISGIEFLPMQQEWYDLVFLADRARTPAMRAIVNYISSGTFQKEVAQMKDYDSSQTGRIILGGSYL